MTLKQLLFLVGVLLLGFNGTIEAKKIKISVGRRMILKYEYFEDCKNVSTLQVHMLMSNIQQIETNHEFVVNADVFVDTEIDKIEHEDTYRLRNGTLDMDIISHLPVPEVERYFWRMRIEAFRPHMFVCWEIATRVFKIRA